MSKRGYVYIMASMSNRVLYTGVTSNLERRVAEHKNGEGSAFTKKYKLHKLVYYEEFPDIRQAIEGEKQIKDGPRKRKDDLVKSVNPKWRDLAEEWI